MEFPDGEIDCGTFPSQYGALELPYLNLGGWSGLQLLEWSNGAVVNIVTGVAGYTCQDRMMCSYACPPGYQKSQWPAIQGATGQSIGGLECKNGMLYLTNPTLSKSLCIPGVGGVYATNQADGVIAICRTDYPGTESETIPVEIPVGETAELANPDGATYYKWQGKVTSAQYYLNPINTPAINGCQWGDPHSGIGNDAPMNLGVGYSDGKTWLSLIPNKPTTLTPFEGRVEIQGDLSDKCEYQNGQYCSRAGCSSDGCTVSVLSGIAMYVISS